MNGDAQRAADLLEDVLAEVIADERTAWLAERARIEAEARADIAGFRAEIAELKGHLRAVHDGEIQALRAAVAQVEKAISMVRDGRDGEPGPPGERGEPGKDADPEQVAALVSEQVTKAVAALPPPEKGEPGPPGPPGEQGEPGQNADPLAVEVLVAERVEKAVAALPPPDPGPQGPPGEAGRDADPETVAALVAEHVEKATVTQVPDLLQRMVDDAVAALPPPERGEPGPVGPQGERGEPGRDADPDAVAALVEEQVTRAVAVLPPPERGETGPQGEQGPTGEPGKDADPALIARMVAEAVAEIPPPKDGSPGPPGERGERGEMGERGADGRGLADAWIGEDGTLLVSLTDETEISVGPVIGPAGPQGERGADGPAGPVGPEGRGVMDAAQNDTGELVLKLTDDRELNVGRIVGPAGAPGEKGEPGASGPQGELGPAGKDGVGLAGAMIDRTGALVVTLTDGRTQALGTIVGKDGAPGARGEPGKDVAPELVERLVRDAVATIPPPDPGPPGPPGDPGPAGEQGPAGIDGRDGKDADPVEVAALLTEDVTKAVADIVVERMPAPERGADGRGIEDVRLDDGLLVVELTDGSEKALGEIIGPPGAPGRDGKDGRDAEPAVSVTDAAIDADGNLHLMLSDKTVLVPGRVVGAPGRDGADGAPGLIGERGEKGDPGLPGRDGVGLAGALIDRTGALVVTLSDGSTRDLGPVVGKDGAPGERGADGAHGRDGLSFESFVLESEYDGERTITLKWIDAAGKEQARTWRLPLVIDRGIYKAGEEYEAGDATTFGGSVWIAQKATATKPGNGNPDWRLAVKSGRDGRDGKDGAKGDRGPPGPPAPGFGGPLLPGGGT